MLPLRTFYSYLILVFSLDLLSSQDSLARSFRLDQMEFSCLCPAEYEISSVR
jgi:hypothetical protein